MAVSAVRRPRGPRARPTVATTYTTAASADSRYATGASPNRVAICTAARAPAASAKVPYTATRTRPGPDDPGPAVSAGAPRACRSRTGGLPQLEQSPDHDADDHTGHGEHRAGPAGPLRPGPQHAGHRDEEHSEQVADERRGVLGPV